MGASYEKGVYHSRNNNDSDSNKGGRKKVGEVMGNVCGLDGGNGFMSVYLSSNSAASMH